MNFGAAVRDARRLQGWTQEELGWQSGFSRQAINRLEKNRGRISTLAAVEASLGLKFIGVASGANWAARVCSSRLARGLSVPAAARMANIAENTVRGIEIGSGSVESLTSLVAALAPETRVSQSSGSRPRLFNINGGDARARLERSETYRTPRYSFTPLLDYCPEWFAGSGCDPSAGDGRMLEEIVARGNRHPHWANDIREEEAALMRAALPATTTITAADYLKVKGPPLADFMLTNPPFTLALDFVQKARTHISGPICILQSVAWQGTAKRSRLLKDSGLAYVLNLSRRPKWEVDIGKAHSNIWDFAWFVFLPDHDGLPQMDWLVER